MTGRDHDATLHVRAWPPVDTGGPAMALLHGFTQNGDCWGRFADRLACTHNVVAVDAPGHGRSGHDEAGLWRSAELVASTLDEALPERDSAPVVIGYSMGGRLALHLALSKPHRVSRLVLIGATAGIDDEQERAARRRADHELADRIESQPLAEFIDGWLANPLFSGLEPGAAAREQRLRNRPEGLAASLRQCGTGSQGPLWDRLGELTMPVLLMVGRADTKFSALADRMAETMTNADVSVSTIDGTHAVHLEQPIEAADTITTWLDP